LSERRAYVIDTSFLLELFRVPEHSTTEHVEEIQRRFKRACASKSTRVVPVVCILEWGARVASIRMPENRAKAASVLQHDVGGALREAGPHERPFVISEAPHSRDLPALIASWSNQHVSQRIGLVDSAVAAVAKTLKEDALTRTAVHIWTKDHALKRLEPDVEPDPFLGS
jgi:predicted nucleic acid-binding protein